jgi:hypothetical protein
MATTARLPVELPAGSRPFLLRDHLKSVVAADGARRARLIENASYKNSVANSELISDTRILLDSRKASPARYIFAIWG